MGFATVVVRANKEPWDLWPLQFSQRDACPVSEVDQHRDDVRIGSVAFLSPESLRREAELAAVVTHVCVEQKNFASEIRKVVQATSSG